MNHLMFFLVLFADGAQCFPVTPGQGGNTSVHRFYCKHPGCAANVASVYCNDELVFSRIHKKSISNCTGLPPPKSVCQHDGRAIVSTDTDGQCEFEGEASFIETEKCTASSACPDSSVPAEDNSSICAPITDTTPSVLGSSESGVILNTDTTLSALGPTEWGVILLVLLGLSFLVGLIACVCKKRRSRTENQQQGSDPGAAEPLAVMQSSGNNSERDPPDGPALDDGTSPFQNGV